MKTRGMGWRPRAQNEDPGTGPGTRNEDPGHRMKTQDTGWRPGTPGWRPGTRDEDTGWRHKMKTWDTVSRWWHGITGGTWHHGRDMVSRPGHGFMAGTQPGPDIKARTQIDGQDMVMTAEARSGSREPSSWRQKWKPGAQQWKTEVEDWSW